MGLEWSSEDMAELYAAQFRDEPSAPPPDLPYGQFRIGFLKTFLNQHFVGWASGYAYSPTLRRMISLARLDRAVQAGDKVQSRWSTSRARSAACRSRCSTATTSSRPTSACRSSRRC